MQANLVPLLKLCSPKRLTLHICRKWSLKMISNEHYFTRRAFEEASRAARTSNADAKRWHQELAEKFSRLARGQ
jgi:hypothetical protein